MNSTLQSPECLATALSITSSAERTLPPLPPADERYFEVEKFTGPSRETVEVLRPRNAEYKTTDPNAPALVLVPGLGMDCRGYIKQLPLGALADLHMPQAMNDGVDGEEGLGHFARH